MKRDEIVDGEAMSAVEGNDVTYLLGSSPDFSADDLRRLSVNVVDMRGDLERAAFNAYRVAFRANEANPTLKSAVALVDAGTRLGDVMGVDLIEQARAGK